MTRLTRFFFAFVFLFAFAAFAQDPVAADPVNLLAAGVKTLAESAQNKNWALFIPTLVVMLVTAFRWIGAKVAAEGTKFRTFLDSKWTKWGMNFVTTLAGAFIGAATANMPITANLVINALMMSFAAAGGVEFFRDLGEVIGTKKATTAGNSAVADPGKTLNG